jgi:8-amino-7-oxononanoate synthase
MPEVDSYPGPVITVGNKRALNFSSNNYLGLAGHEALIEASVEAVRKYGAGATASRLIAGNIKPHRELESLIADWKSTEAALVFNSGYQANVGTLASVVGEGDLIISDELNHASIIDGCRISRAHVKVYPHLDLEAMERLLEEGSYNRRLVITESVFSMDGDMAPLAEIQRLTNRRSALLMVDEAHGAGVLGPQGEGLCAEKGARPHIQMGTLGKALGCSGAYIAADRDIIELIINRARPFIYTTAAPPSVIGSCIAAIEVVRSSEGAERRRKLRENCRLFADLINEPLDRQRFAGHIKPVIIGASDTTMRVSQGLLERGIFAHGIRYPTVAEGSARIRFTLMSDHEQSHLESAAQALGSMIS